MFTFNLQQKSDTFIAMKAFKAYVRIQQGKPSEDGTLMLGGNSKARKLLHG